MSEIKIPIPARLKNVAKGGHVAGAEDIMDDALNKEQSVINQETLNSLDGIDNRIDAIQQKVDDIGDSIQFDEDGDLVTEDGSDFSDDTARGKIPTIGAIKDGLNDGIYDVSKRNPTGGSNSDGKFTLDYILANADSLIPTSWRHGGMSISFVSSVDNKYLQYRLMSDTFSTTESDWQGVDDAPTAGSNNLVKSGGVAGLYEKPQTCISEGRNTDFVLNYPVDNGETVIFTVENATNTYNVVLFDVWPFNMSNPYQSLRNNSDNGTFEVDSIGNWRYLHLFDQSEENTLSVTIEKNGAITQMINAAVTEEENKRKQADNLINEKLFAENIIQTETASGRNSDFELDKVIKNGESLKLTVSNATDTYNVVLCDVLPFSQSNPYQSLRNNSDNGTFEVVSEGEWKYLHLFDSSEGNVLTVSLEYGGGVIKQINDELDAIKQENSELNEKLFAEEKIQTETASGRNSDFELDTPIESGETIKLTIINATNTYNIVLFDTLPFSQSNPYQSLRNSADNGTFEVVSDGKWKYLHLFDSSEGNILQVTLEYGKGELAKLEGEIEDLSGKFGNYVCLGDSITSDEITGIGTLICNELEATKVGNFAHGNAHCSNWNRLGTDVTPVTFDTLVNANTPDNVLSNQVIRILRNTTPLGQQVKWTHPTAGEQSIPTEVGTGLGNTSQIPNVIYIAISTNDGKVVSGYSENVGGEGQYGGQTGIGDNTPTPVIDNCDIVFEQAYNQLDKMSIASALRWSIETLRCVYPNAAIFVASPLQTNYGYITSQFGNKLNFIKSEIVKKVCKFCSVYFIDSYGESGYSDIIARTKGGIHPGNEWKQYIAKYVANRIRTALKKTKNDLYY